MVDELRALVSKPPANGDYPAADLTPSQQGGLWTTEPRLATAKPLKLHPCGWIWFLLFFLG